MLHYKLQRMDGLLGLVYSGGGALLQLFLRLGSIHKSQMNGFPANPPRYEFYYRFKDLFFRNCCALARAWRQLSIAHAQLLALALVNEIL